LRALWDSTHHYGYAVTDVITEEPQAIQKRQLWASQYAGWAKKWRFDESFWKDVTTRTISAFIAAGLVGLAGIGLASAVGWISRPEKLSWILYAATLIFLLALFFGVFILILVGAMWLMAKTNRRWLKILIWLAALVPYAGLFSGIGILAIFLFDLIEARTT
jgi:hypothetical protein